MAVCCGADFMLEVRGNSRAMAVPPFPGPPPSTSTASAMRLPLSNQPELPASAAATTAPGNASPLVPAGPRFPIVPGSVTSIPDPGRFWASPRTPFLKALKARCGHPKYSR